MNTPASAVGCSNCGSLYLPAPGDEGLCSTCRLQGLDPSSEGPGAGSALAGLFRGRSVRHIGIVAGGALLVAALGTWFVMRRRLPDAPQVDRSALVASAPTPRATDGETSPAKATLQRAQLQVEAGKTKAAEKTLKPLLRQKLPRDDRAFALRLMGAAEARRGHRRAAVAWYRKSMKVTDDAAERERVARRIQQITRARSKKELRAAGDPS